MMSDNPVVIDKDTAITIKTMLAFAVSQAPETLHKDYSEARSKFIKAFVASGKEE